MLELASTLRFRLNDGEPPELAVEGYPLETLTSVEVESTVSAVARHPAVRRVMCMLQRDLGADGAVMEGRDIGSVVFPDAEVKLFLQAGEDARAGRRATERSVPPADAEGALAARDARDAHTTPLEPVADAVVIDTSALDIEETLAAALEIVRARWPESRA